MSVVKRSATYITEDFKTYRPTDKDWDTGCRYETTTVPVENFTTLDPKTKDWRTGALYETTITEAEDIA